jgi:dTDP-4-dehydrorhamnose reductase
VSPHRGNFLKTMLRLAQEKPKLRVVGDQIGCPTAAGDLADALARVALRLLDDRTAPFGTYHCVNGGETSWHGLAAAIVARAASHHGRLQPEVEAITTAEYPTPARRPANSRLSTERLRQDYDIRPRHWTDAIAETVDRVLQA